MKKSVIYTLAATALLVSALSACSIGSDDTGDSTPAEQTSADPTINVFGEYALMDGFIVYTSPDGGFSIQLPEGCTVDDADPANVTVSIAGYYETPDLINISKSQTAERITSTAELMKMLESDNSIDITGYFNISLDGAYEGYKYTYTSIDNENLKGIVSTFFSADGTAYIVNATINNGGDEANVTNVNTIVDTFINYL